MAPIGTEKEWNLLLDCIRHGELIKVDWAAIDRKNGSQNKNPGATAQMAFNTLRKKYGLQKAGGQSGFSQACGTKRRRDMEAPVKTEDCSKGGKKAKVEANGEGPKGDKKVKVDANEGRVKGGTGDKAEN